MALRRAAGLWSTGPAPRHRHRTQSLTHSPSPFPQDLPEDWQCPVCSAPKKLFELKQTEVAGFAENQGYGLGTNSMTGAQKSGLIYGSLVLFFLLFLLGYTMN